MAQKHAEAVYVVGINAVDSTNDRITFSRTNPDTARQTPGPAVNMGPGAGDFSITAPRATHGYVSGQAVVIGVFDFDQTMLDA